MGEIELSAPSPKPSDGERQVAVDRVQQALADDVIGFDELDRRFEAIFSAGTVDELDRAMADLPELAKESPSGMARLQAPVSQSAVFGDIRIGGWLAVSGQMKLSAFLGDVTVDLSSASIDGGAVDLDVRSVFGDIKVIVPDGARVPFEANALLGDQRCLVSAPVDGGPEIRIKARTTFGDIKVYSLSLLPTGRLRRLWASLRENTS